MHGEIKILNATDMSIRELVPTDFTNLVNKKEHYFLEASMSEPLGPSRNNFIVEEYKKHIGTDAP